MASRNTTCINGLWDFSPASGKLGKIPTKWEKTKIVVPCPWNINSFAGPEEVKNGNETLFARGGEYNFYPQYPSEWDNADSGWYKTEVFIPENWKGLRVNLCFNAVHFYSEFYINGVLVNKDMDGFLPVEFPVSEHVRYGESNTLVVGVEKLSLYGWKNSEGRKKIEYPTGSFWGEHIGGIWQDVFLKTYPENYIKDMYVYTDIDSCTISVETELESAQEEKEKICYFLSEYGKNDYISLDGNFEGAAGEKLKHELDYSSCKNDIKLWWPHSPRLYMLKARLYINGSIADEKTVRFGFRSFKIKENKFYLNEIPYNLRNDSWHYMGFAYQNEMHAKLWYKMAREANVNCIRLHAQVYPEFFIDIADEEGMLIIDESSVWASHCNYHYSEEFFKRSEKHVERLIKRDRNHPSVIMWSVENECVAAYKVSADEAIKDEEDINKKLYRLAEFAKKLDPVRPVIGDGSKDYGGRMEVASLHYPGKSCPVSGKKPVVIGEMGTMYYSTPDNVCGYLGEKTYLEFDNRLEAVARYTFESLKHQRKWAAQVCVFNLVWYGLYPLPFKESIRQYGDYSAPGIKPTKTGPYISTLNAGYDDNLPEYVANPVFKWVKGAFLPERFFFEDEKVRFYNGERVNKCICVHNDSLSKKDYEVSWAVEREEKIFCSGTESISILPSEFKMLELDFELPEVEKLEHFNLKVVLSDSRGTVFADRKLLKIYNPSYFVKKIGAAGKIGFIGSIDEKIKQFLNSDNIRFLPDNSKLDNFDLLVTAGKVPEDVRNRIKSSSASAIDLSPAGNGCGSWVTQAFAEKAFINIDNEVLKRDIEEDDLYKWNGKNISDHIFSEDINLNADVLLSTGKGLPLVLELIDNIDNKIISCIDMLSKVIDEPAALVLLTNIIGYAAAGKGVELSGCTVISKKNSRLVRFLEELNVPLKLIDPYDRSAVKSIENQKVIICDGKYDTGYLDEMMPENIDKVLLWGLEKENMPKSLKGFIKIVEKPLNQLVKSDDKHYCIKCLSAGNLYGLETGNKAVISEKPVYIKDSQKIKGILKNSSINWFMWNYQPEFRKTISILRSEKEQKQDVYGLAETSINGVEVFICQINCLKNNNKLKKIAGTILNNMGVEIKYKETDEFDKILKQDIYEEALIKALLLNSPDDLKITGLTPGINKTEGKASWKIVNLDKNNKVPGGVNYYGFFVHSESQRTDFLLNPDIISMNVISTGMKQVYLNHECVGSGNEISIKALKLTAGLNKFIIREERKDTGEKPPVIEFKRKDIEELDLKFFLEQEGITEIKKDDWIIKSNYNSNEAANAIRGKGYFWQSNTDQKDGMYWQADLNKIHKISKLQFNSKKSGNQTSVFLPRSFVILISIDGCEWSEAYRVKNEKDLTIVDGKVVISLHNEKAKYVKVQLTSVALKPLIISDLRIFTHKDI